MMITLIAAVARDGAIGREGQLLWHIPADLRHFKQLTKGYAVVMGRNTWENLPFRPLPGRLNVIITSNPAFQPLNAKGLPADAESVAVAGSLEEGVRIAEANSESGSPVFIIGGGRVYAEALPLADALELTEIDADCPDADTFFPQLNAEDWHLSAKTHVDNDPDSPVSYSFCRYLRVNENRNHQ